MLVGRLFHAAGPARSEKALDLSCVRVQRDFG